MPNTIKEITYYFPQEEIVFKNKDSARRYFDKEKIFDSINGIYEWRDYLANRFYYDEIFDFTNDEKEQVCEDYKEWIFDNWVENELIRCEVYDDEDEG